MSAGDRSYAHSYDSDNQNIPTCFRSNRPGVFYKKGALKNFAKFTRKHLCQSLFFRFFFFIVLWLCPLMGLFSSIYTGWSGWSWNTFSLLLEIICFPHFLWLFFIAKQLFFFKATSVILPRQFTDCTCFVLLWLFFCRFHCRTLRKIP